MFDMHHVLELLKKDLFVIMNGYMCNYDFMQGPLYSFFYEYSFCGGCFCKISVHLMHGSQILLVSLHLK